MKKSLNAWSVESTLTFEEMFAAVSQAGFEGIELNVDASGVHSITLETTEADYAAIRALSQKYGLPVVSISTSLWGGKMGIPEQWEDGKALLRKQLEAAAALGAKSILTVPGGMGGDITLAGARENSLAFMRAMKPEIEAQDVLVGVENVWNGFFLSPYDMTSFIDAVDSPKLGAYLDLGNMLAFSISEYWVEVLGSRIVSCHAKDYLRAGGLNSGGTWEDITHGSANWPAIIPALRKTGFDGYITGEVFRAGDISFPDYYKKVAGEIGAIIQY